MKIILKTRHSVTAPAEIVLIGVTDLHNNSVHINPKNIAYYYEQGGWAHIYTNAGLVVATDTTVEELNNILRTY